MVVGMALVMPRVALADAGGVPAEVAALQAAVATIQTALATSQSQVAALQSAVSGLQSANTTLQGSVSALQTNVSLLQTNVSSLQTNVFGLQSNVSGLQSSVSSLQTANVTLQSEVSALQVVSASIGVKAVTRGSVLFNGTITAGSGFTVLPAPPGRYIVAYTPSSPFTEVPSCVVSAQQGQQPAEGANFYCKIDSADKAGLVVQCYNPPGLISVGGGIAVDTTAGPGNFEFICAQ